MYEVMAANTFQIMYQDLLPQRLTVMRQTIVFRPPGLPSSSLSMCKKLCYFKQMEINKNLKFKKGVEIAIKSKETSSKLAI